MKKLFTTLLMAGACFTANAQYQLANGTFDGDFVDCYPWEKGTVGTKAYGTQPNGWCMSNVPNSLAEAMASQVEGHNGKAVRLTNTAAMGNGIPAYLTLGTTWATAETRMTSTRNKDGGAFGGVAFSKHPDALKFFYKRDGKDKADESKIYIYTWKGTWTQASVPSNTAVGVFSWGSATKVDMTDRDVNILGRDYAQGGAVTKTADAELIAVGEKTITGSQTDWKECVLPLEYKSNNAPEKINIVFSAAGYISTASITEDVSLTVDDVELLYYSELKSATYDGNDVSFDGTSATVDEVYDECKLVLTSNGRAATIEKSYDPETALLTVTVKGENISEDADNKHVYTIQFAKKETYTEDLYVTVDGMTSVPQETTVVVTRYSDHFDFSLKNFVLGEGEASMPVGNINVANLVENVDGTFTFQGNITIADGDDSNVGWFGPYLGEVPLDLSGKFVDENNIEVSIDIDMVEIMGQMILVHLGVDPATCTCHAHANMVVNAAAKYGTFCAPFNVIVPEYVVASTATIDENGHTLVLTELEFDDGAQVIPANTPVILFAEEGLEAVSFMGKGVAGNPVAGCLTGVYARTSAQQGSYILQNHDGKVGFYKVANDGLFVGANRCYLSKPASNVKAYYLNADDAETETAIETLNALVGGKAEIYDLNGRRLQKLQKGANIVNGKKVIVK